MKTLSPKTALVAAMVAIGSLSALSGCGSTGTHETVGQYSDDSMITAKVKYAFAKDPVVKAYQVDVETYRGVVQLSGFVDSQASIQRAGQLAHSVPGVRDVKNEIQVKPMG